MLLKRLIHGSERRLVACLIPFLFSFHASARDNLSAQTNYYPVVGGSMEEIYQSMRASRPWKDKLPFDAQTLWDIQWRFDLRGQDGSCSANNFRTSTRLTFTFPLWTPPTNASPALVKEWRRFFEALRVHEGGHAAIAMEAVRAVQQMTNSPLAALDCPSLQTRINDDCKRLIDQYRKKEREYDIQTRHGATQGVRL